MSRIVPPNVMYPHFAARGCYVPPDCPPCDVEPHDPLSEEFSEIGRNAGSALSLPLYGALMFGLGMLCHWAWP